MGCEVFAQPGHGWTMGKNKETDYQLLICLWKVLTWTFCFISSSTGGFPVAVPSETLLGAVDSSFL